MNRYHILNCIALMAGFWLQPTCAPYTNAHTDWKYQMISTQIMRVYMNNICLDIWCLSKIDLILFSSIRFISLEIPDENTNTHTIINLECDIIVIGWNKTKRPINGNKWKCYGGMRSGRHVSFVSCCDRYKSMMKIMKFRTFPYQIRF